MDTHEFARKIWNALAETLPTASVCNAEIGINATNFRLDVKELNSSSIDKVAVSVYREKGPGATKLFITEPRVSYNGHFFVIEFSFRWDVPKVDAKDSGDDKPLHCCHSMIEHDFDISGDEVFIKGCCGGCYVTDAITFCPFCGKKIALGESRKPSDIIDALIEGYRSDR